MLGRKTFTRFVYIIKWLSTWYKIILESYRNANISTWLFTYRHNIGWRQQYKLCNLSRHSWDESHSIWTAGDDWLRPFSLLSTLRRLWDIYPKVSHRKKTAMESQMSLGFNHPGLRMSAPNFMVVRLKTSIVSITATLM